MVKGLFVDFKYLPSKENAMWAGVGGSLALALHPLDDNVNSALVGNSAAETFFKPGAILGALPTLLGSASIVYAVGRVKDEPKVSHVGMDLIQAIAMSEIITESLKYATGRERPDQSGATSFPSGHAADTFAFATALERHLGWRYAVPAYLLASYVATSRLPANRHWLSDVVFGSAVGIIAGRTVTSHEAQPFPVVVSVLPGGRRGHVRASRPVTRAQPATVQEAIRAADAVLPGRAAPEGAEDPRWQAIIAVGRFLESEPDAVWQFIQRWGVHADDDLRMAIATCLLEHLLSSISMRSSRAFRSWFVRTGSSPGRSDRAGSSATRPRQAMPSGSTRCSERHQTLDE